MAEEQEGAVVESGQQNDSPAVAATSDTVEKKREGFFSRLWNGIFRVRSDDFEKRVQYISREEATVLSRIKRRSITWRKLTRNLIVSSVMLEDGRFGLEDEEFSSLANVSLTCSLCSCLFLNRQLLKDEDQKILEKLRAERLAKINELKERTNYYTTQQLIQRYDPDPAAKAAAATVLASKLGSGSGLKVFLGDESQLDPSSGKSNDLEVNQSRGLRNRKQPNTRSHSSGGTSAHHSDDDSHHSGTVERFPGTTEQNQQMLVEHYSPQGYAAHNGSWISRIAALLVGEDPTQSFALICGNCHMHNGLARKEDFAYITYYCPHCKALNKPKHSDEDTIPPVSGLLATESPTLIETNEVVSKRGNSLPPEVKEEALTTESGTLS